MLCEKNQLIPASAGLVNSAESAPQQANKMCICYMFVSHPHCPNCDRPGGKGERQNKGLFLESDKEQSKMQRHLRCKCAGLSVLQFIAEQLIRKTHPSAMRSIHMPPSCSAASLLSRRVAAAAGSLVVPTAA